MSFVDVSENLENGFYNIDKVNVSLWEEDRIVDENLSEEENAKIVRLHNETCLKKEAKYKKDAASIGKKLRVDVVCSIVDDYSLDKETAMYIEKWVYSETKNKPREEYVQYAEIISDFVVGMPGYDC